MPERPGGLLGREEWASDAVLSALEVIEGRSGDLVEPAPLEVELDLPDLDFGP